MQNFNKHEKLKHDTMEGCNNSAITDPKYTGICDLPDKKIPKQLFLRKLNELLKKQTNKKKRNTIK